MLFAIDFVHAFEYLRNESLIFDIHRLLKCVGQFKVLWSPKGMMNSAYLSPAYKVEKQTKKVVPHL